MSMTPPQEGNSSLHDLVRKKEWDRVMDTLETVEGQRAVLLMDDDGNLPLFNAIRYNAPVAVVEMIVNAGESTNDLKWYRKRCIDRYVHPDDVFIHYGPGGETALHRAHDPETVRLLLEIDSRAAALPSLQDGRYPLHNIFRNGKGSLGTALKSVILLADCYPAALEIQDIDGFLPIHYACSNVGSLMGVFVIEEIIRRCPESVQVPNDSRRLPLHVLCSQCCSNIHVVKALIAAFPEATMIRDRCGDVPAKLCYLRNSELLNTWGYPVRESLVGKVAAFIIQIQPAALYVTNNVHHSLADSVASGKLGLTVEEILADAYPKGIAEATFASEDEARKDSTFFKSFPETVSPPLHVACRYSAPIEFVREIVRQCPESVRIRDGSSRRSLPLHVACQQRYTQIAIIRFLIHMYGGALQLTDGDGRTPFMVACHHEMPASILYELLRENPEEVRAFVSG